MRRARSVLPALLLASLPAAGAEPPSRAEEVAALLSGTFDSSAQSSSDPEGFRAVRLVAARGPAGPPGAGAPGPYGEPALPERPEPPDPAPVYRIEETADGGVVSRVFEPKEPVAVSGKWRDPSDLALYGAGDVVERLGCAVRLKRTDDGWSGSTEGKDCPSALSGARWATSEVTLRPGRLESWDRGYDVEGRQVWGARSGPYVFERRTDGPPSASPR